MKRIEPEFEQPELDGVEAAIFPIKQAIVYPDDYHAVTFILDRPTTDRRVSPLRAGQEVIFRLASQVVFPVDPPILYYRGFIADVGEGVVRIRNLLVFNAGDDPWSSVPGAVAEDEMLRLPSGPVPWRAAWPAPLTYP